MNQKELPMNHSIHLNEKALGQINLFPKMNGSRKCRSTINNMNGYQCKSNNTYQIIIGTANKDNKT